MIRQKALLLDRDGVININHGYVHTTKEFDFVNGIFELTREAFKKDYMIIVITNQAGIGRGYYSEQQFHDLSKWMCERFLKQGVPITKVYFSPYHPISGLGIYKKDDFSRKPNPGMILQAQKEFGLNLQSSLLIGDKESDIQAGLAVGIPNNFLFSPELKLAIPTYFEEKVTQVSRLSEIIPFL
jgi:D-glycero-D-manno-heptose 1,7-bisphosphate phosphatase